MHKFRTVLTVVATAAMVLGTMGVAAAAGSSSNETRAQFIQQLDESLSISPVYPATASYQDVPSSNAYYGYIEAATQKGFVNGISAGMFGPNDPITRAEAAKILVEAYGDGAQATATSTTFTDNSSIPTALVGFVAEASKLGLMKGFTDGSFGPEAYLTSAQETHLVSQLQTTLAASFKVTASASDVAVGQIVTLSSSSGGTVTYTVTGSNASSALVSGSSFVASTPGNYTVTGTTAGGATATATISVYGGAAALKINLPQTVVANGASTNTITVDVVDGNGNIVANSSDEVTLSGLGSVFGAGSTDVYATNGVATFNLPSGSVPGAITTLTAHDVTAAGAVPNATASVTAAAQVATSISVSAPQYLSANAAGTSEPYTATVEDQTGNPMLYGTWGLTATLTGPTSSDGAGTMTQTAAYSNGINASFTLYDVQGQTGAISITVAGSGLTSGTGTTTAVIAGTPVALQISDNAGSSVNADTEATAAFANLTVTAVDSHGYPAVWSGTADIAVTSGGAAVAEFTGANNLVFPAAPATLVSSKSEAITGAGDAGTYTFTVSDAAAGLTGNSVSLSVTPGAPTKVVASAPAYVSISSPTGAVSAQLEDAYGNPVSQAGVTVNFAITTPASSNATLATASAATNAQGVATDTLSLPYALGTNYIVTASSLGLTSGLTKGTQVEGTIANSVVVKPYATQVTAGNNVQFDVYAYDQYGVSVGTADTISLTFSNTVGAPTLSYGTATSNGGGNYTVTVPAGVYLTVTAQAQAAGPVTVTAQDTSVASQPSGSASFVVTPGSLAGYLFVDASGNIYGSGTKGTPATKLAGITANQTFTETANVPVEVWLEAVDAFGNPIVVPGSTGQTVTLAAPSGGSFRTSENGVDVSTLTPPNVVTIPSGTTELPLWYVNGAGVTSPTANFFNGAAD